MIKSVLKTIAFLALIFGGIGMAFAQGTVESNLSTLSGVIPSVTGYATFVIPQIDEQSLNPVTFHITINSDQISLTTGRIYGGSTAWSFSLGTATIENGQTRFNGVTEMTSHQITDMFNGVTDFELNDEVNQSSYLSGAVQPVPEPTTLSFLMMGSIIVGACVKRRMTV